MLTAHIDNEDETAALHGIMRLADTVLIAERSGATASCADTNGDGTAGVTLLKSNFKMSTGDEATVYLHPVDEDIDASDRYLVDITVEVEGRSVSEYRVVIEVRLVID